MKPLDKNDANFNIDQIIKSWQEHFNLRAPALIKSLRPPQIGSVLSIFSHWTLTSSTAMIVLPTGLGKTDTMLATIMAYPLQRTLILVPSDNLRTQISEKLGNLGIFKELNLIDDSVLYPKVLKLTTTPNSKSELLEAIKNSNIIVATVQLVCEFTNEYIEAFTENLDAVFFDEAHHIEADSWSKLKNGFVKESIKVVQFTATPFRNDKKELEGKIIYRYPLSKAQEEGYFRKINLYSLFEFDDLKHDRNLAERGIEILKKDIQGGFSHVLMARARSIERAIKIAEIYEKIDNDLRIEVLYSDMKERDKTKIMDDLLKNHIQVIVCVDMLGEGFDFPNLKIAVLHDPHKSLPKFIQFIGRFTRSSSSLKIGDASIVINKANDDTSKDLSQLYEIDADWNKIITEKVDSKVATIKEKQDFDSQFISEKSLSININQLIPSLSTLAFKTKSVFYPEKLLAFLFQSKGIEIRFVEKSQNERILIIVYSNSTECDWIKEKNTIDVSNNLLICYQKKDRGITFINSINKDLNFKQIAEILTGNQVEPLNGEIPFRVLDGLKNSIFTTGGIRSSGRIRFNMLAGTNIIDDITPETIRNKSITNLFCSGHDYGIMHSYGCARKGTIWSHKRGNVFELIQWFNSLVPKLLNDSFEFDNVLRYALRRETITQIPSTTVALVEWEDRNLSKLSRIYFNNGFHHVNLLDSRLTFQGRDSEIIFLKLEANEFEYNFSFTIPKDGKKKYYSSCGEGSIVTVDYNGTNVNLLSFLLDYPLIIYFVDGSYLINSDYYCSKQKFEIISDTEYLQPCDWGDVKQNKEAMVSLGDNTVQGVVYNNFIDKNCDIIFYDDGADEIADFITIKLDQVIQIKFYHCKWVANDQDPGARMKDVGELSEQIVKSLRWKDDIKFLFKRLLKRSSTKAKHGIPRLIKGSEEILSEYWKMAGYTKFADIEVFGATPGLSLEAYNGRAKDPLKALLNFAWQFAKDRYGVSIKYLINK
jgi:superfamily II DNA or RNA helicase